jgi:hypothetical protein
VVTTDLLRSIRAQLKHNGAPGVSGGDGRKKYIGVCDSFNAQDIMADTTFVESAKFQNLQPLTSGEFGEWMGIRWQESNHIPVIRRSDAVEVTSIGYAEAVPSGATNVPDGTYKIALTAYDASGFESIMSNTDFGTGTYTGAPSGSNDVIKIILPALSPATDSGVSTSHTFDPGPVAYNIYCTAAGGSTYFKQASNLAGGTYYIVGSDTTGASDRIVLNATGAAPPTQPADGVNVHQMFVFGNEWYQVAELEGIRTLMTPSGAQKGDELAQRRSVGWKFFSKALITNENFGCRIETESNYDTALTA